MRNKIKPNSTLFFDLDDTLVDTNEANFSAYQEAIQIVKGIKFKFSYNLEKRFNRDELDKIAGISEAEKTEIIQLKTKLFDKYIGKTKLIESTVNILNRYTQTHTTILLTNCRKHRAKTIINCHNLGENFKEIFFRPETKKGKHDFNKFQYAITHLNVDPNNVVVFEDEQKEVDDALMAAIPRENIFLVNK